MKKKMPVILMTILCLAGNDLQAGVIPQMRTREKLLIREAIHIADKVGEKIWKGIGQTPFALILVTDSIEFLVYHPNPSADFVLSEQDSILNTAIYYRKRQYQKYLLATFPAVNGVNCIVAGTPENTSLHVTAWIITLLHEHFHQFEYSSPGYYKDVENLKLSGGDQTGMWMLNYPFPYDSLPVKRAYENYVIALDKAIKMNSTRSQVKKYSEARNELRRTLSPADYRYFSFQVWQEGLARYAEYMFLQQLNDYAVSPEVAVMPGFLSFREYSVQLYQREIKNLIALPLNEGQRICFYSVGFAEGLLLDQIKPGWRDKLLDKKFDIDLYKK